MIQAIAPVSLRRAEYDVTNEVDTTSALAVSFHVARIYERAYQQDVPSSVLRLFADVERLFRGEFPGYYGCETDYHDAQHTLEVTLAMARLMAGYLDSNGTRIIGERHFLVGLAAALFHDIGYLRRVGDSDKRHGAEYMRIHVSRGADFLAWYLPEAGLSELAADARGIVHFTGYEIPVQRIGVGPELRLLGNLLGSADILAQMSDRCYLEKCLDRLYPEFVLGGIARQVDEHGDEKILFASAEDLIFKTPGFFKGAYRRLEQDLDGVYRYADRCFGGVNLYFHEARKNFEYARRMAQIRDISCLRRRMPDHALPKAA